MLNPPCRKLISMVSSVFFPVCYQQNVLHSWSRDKWWTKERRTYPLFLSSNSYPKKEIFLNKRPDCIMDNDHFWLPQWLSIWHLSKGLESIKNRPVSSWATKHHLDLFVTELVNDVHHKMKAFLCHNNHNVFNPGYSVIKGRPYYSTQYYKILQVEQWRTWSSITTDICTEFHCREQIVFALKKLQWFIYAFIYPYKNRDVYVQYKCNKPWKFKVGQKLYKHCLRKFAGLVVWLSVHGNLGQTSSSGPVNGSCVNSIMK